MNGDRATGRASLLRFHALRDVLEKRPSSGNNLDALDGIRGLAVLIVLASHSGAFGMKGHGGVGVWLFFSLSAFLLTLPFIDDPTRARRLGPLLHYFSRRCLRILPAYYTVVVTTFLLEDADLPFLWQHLLFLRGDGIWWTIPQEMLFYILLPALATLHTFFFFRGTLALALTLCLIALLANYVLTPAVFSMNGNGTQLPFYLGLFTSGMAACYAYHVPLLKEWVQRPFANRALGLLGVVLLALLVFTAPHYQQHWLEKLPFVQRAFARISAGAIPGPSAASALCSSISPWFARAASSTASCPPSPSGRSGSFHSLSTSCT